MALFRLDQHVFLSCFVRNLVPIITRDPIDHRLPPHRVDLSDCFENEDNDEVVSFVVDMSIGYVWTKSHTDVLEIAEGKTC